jgi:acetyl/propionyl-CoA carboxylase alpha subunit
MADEVFRLERVLIAHRGAMARRLASFYRSRGVETVMAFSEPDADASWLDEADYDAYLNGASLQDTYLHVERVVSAAMDAGCDAVHPGNGFLAERPELYVRANNANLAILGADPTVVAHAVDRTIQRARAEKLGLSVLPASRALPDGDDGVAAAMAVGLPLWVRSTLGPRLQRVADVAALPEAVASARQRAAALVGDDSVCLERDVGDAEQLSTTVVVDRKGRAYALGTSVARAAGPGGTTWIEELGPELGEPRLTQASQELLSGMRWVGPATVRWVRPGSTTFFQSVSMRLVTAFDLTEAVQGIDLLAAQHAALVGDDLGWPDEVAPPRRYGLQARLLHLGGEGVLEALELPEGAALGVDEGANLGPHTEPLLAKITVVADTRQQAVDALNEQLAQVRAEGVDTNLEGLRAAAAGLPSA